MSGNAIWTVRSFVLFGCLAVLFDWHVLFLNRYTGGTYLIKLLHTSQLTSLFSCASINFLVCCLLSWPVIILSLPLMDYCFSFMFLLNLDSLMCCALLAIRPLANHFLHLQQMLYYIFFMTDFYVALPFWVPLIMHRLLEIKSDA